MYPIRWVPLSPDLRGMLSWLLLRLPPTSLFVRYSTDKINLVQDSWLTSYTMDIYCQTLLYMSKVIRRPRSEELS